MTKLLEDAVNAAKTLPPDVQDELALIIQRRIIDERLASSDVRYAAEGGIEAETFFDELDRKYGD